MTLVPIVEGDSEIESVPVLFRRFQETQPVDNWVTIARPVRVRRNNFLNDHSEFSRSLALARQKAGPEGGILILLDADDDCPAELGSQIKTRAQREIGDMPLGVVLANREYEAWFLASARSLDGHRGFSFSVNDQVQAEGPGGAKEWISNRMHGRPYREVLDQPAFTALMDFDQAKQNSRSFRKLYSEWVMLLGLKI